MFKKKACPLKNIDQLLKDHIDTVEITLITTCDALKEYFAGHIDNAKELSKKVDKIEKIADDIRRDMGYCLYEGKLLPFLRKDFIQLVSSIDSIANGSEAVSDFCLAQRPMIPDEFKEYFIAILDSTIEVFNVLKEALKLLSEGHVSYNIKDSSELHNFTKLVNQKEAEVDDLQWKLTRKIFTNENLELAGKIHIEGFLSKICKLSNLMEDVVERIEIIAIRESI